MKRVTHQKNPLKRLTAILAACLLAGCMLGLVGCLDDYDEPSGSNGSNSSYTQNSSSSNSGKTDNGTAKQDANKQSSQSGKTDNNANKQNSSKQDSNKKLDKNGSYTSKADVALYIHTYGCLPSNFISKTKARNAGWDSSAGNLDEVCPGMSIGGSVFYNDEGKLPEAQGRTWKECDINYHGGYRGSERIVFSSDGLVYYTKDHYKTFEQLY